MNIIKYIIPQLFIKDVPEYMSQKLGKRKRTVQNFLVAGNDWCPLCKCPLTLSNATKEHVPPKSVGNTGGPACLTCQSCNNHFSGHEAWMDRVKRGVGIFDMRDDKGHSIMSGEMVNTAKPGKTIMKIGKGEEWIYEKPKNEMNEKSGLSMFLAPNYARTGTPMKEIASMKIHDISLNLKTAEKGWIKSGFLLAGIATQGEVWKKQWADEVREYLFSDAKHCKHINVIPYNPQKTWNGIFATKDADPGYIILLLDVTITITIPQRYENKDDWLIEVEKHIKGPLIYGQTQWIYQNGIT